MSALFGAVANGLLGSHLVPYRVRTVALRLLLGVDISWGASIRPTVTIRTRRLRLGQASTINYGCVVDNRAPIYIGDRVGVGIGVSLITSTHDLDDPRRRAGRESIAPIVIEDGAWLGSGVTVLGGVRIGHGAVVAAGALVRADCEPDTLYAGVPARLIRRLPR